MIGKIILEKELFTELNKSPADFTESQNNINCRIQSRKKSYFFIIIFIAIIFYLIIIFMFYQNYPILLLILLILFSFFILPGFYFSLIRGDQFISFLIWNKNFYFRRANNIFEYISKTDLQNVIKVDNKDFSTFKFIFIKNNKEFIRYFTVYYENEGENLLKILKQKNVKINNNSVD